MKRTSGLLALSTAVVALVACGGSGDDQPQVKVDDLATGSYVVSVGDTNAPTVGKYYADASGNRLLVLADSGDRVAQLYRREAGKAWVGAPGANKDVNVTLLQSNAVPSKALDVAPLAGSYSVLVGAGMVANFTLQANGDIVAGTSTCKLAGKVTAHTLANTLKLSLTAGGCGSLPASSTGVLVVDADYAPAGFRLVADNGALPLDLWAYKE